MQLVRRFVCTVRYESSIEKLIGCIDQSSKSEWRV